MMNKAKKRELEVSTLGSIYEHCERIVESFKQDVNYYNECLAEELKQNPDYDSTYYPEQIEITQIAIQTYEVVQSMIFKMM